MSPPLSFFFRLNKNFPVKKLNALRQNFDRKVFSPNRPTDVQNMFDLLFVTDWEFEYWWEKFE